ncbi:MAG: chorismate mutase [Candidatus Woesearchaeota archaeon]
MNLDSIREEIESIDDDILRLLAKRMELAPVIGKYKKENGLAITQPEREKSLVAMHVKQGKELGLEPEFVKELYKLIMQEMRKKQCE